MDMDIVTIMDMATHTGMVIGTTAIITFTTVAGEAVVGTDTE